MKRLTALLVALLLALYPASPGHVAEISASSWSETDASNTTASPDGWNAGITGTGAINTGRMMMGATKRFWDRINGTVTSGGSANAYTYTPTNTNFPTAIVTGEVFTFKANFTNTAASTLAVNGLTAKNIFRQTPAGPAALVGGEIRSGQFVTVAYDGTQYQIISPVSPNNILGMSGTAVNGPADTNENTLATIAVPANAVGANGAIRFLFNMNFTNNANAKTVRIRFSGASGTIVSSTNYASVANAQIIGTMFNANATNSQVWNEQHFVTGGALAGTFGGTSSIDTTAARTILITIEKGTAGDTVTLQNYAFELLATGS